MWLAGDNTTAAFMSLNSDPTSPPDINMAFLTGTDDYMLVRQYAKWFDLDYITLQRQDYEDIYTLKTIYAEPWNERVYLNGTDGFQFHPNLKYEDPIAAFVNELSRNAAFSPVNVSSYDYQSPLEMITYQLAESLMYSMEYNPDNALYNTYINGTSNMSNVLLAPVIATKGHYY